MNVVTIQDPAEISTHLNVYDLFDRLNRFSPHLNVSVVISALNRENTVFIDTYTQFSIFDFKNGPAITVFKSSILPNVNVQILRDCLNCFDKNSFDQKIRLLRGEDGFKLNLNNDGKKFIYKLSGFRMIPGLLNKVFLTGMG